MIRVLHVIESLGLGGAERRLFNDVSRLNHDFSHTVVHLFADNALADQFHRRQIQTIGLGLKRMADPKAVPALWRAVKQNRPNLIHTQLFAADCYGRLVGRMLGIPVVSTVQSSVYESPDPYLRSAKHEWADRWTARTCVTRLVAVSEFVRESLKNRFHLDGSRIQVIPNGIDPVPFEKGRPDSARALRHSLGISPDAKVLITVGKLNPPKGHRFVLEALESVRNRFPDLVWLIVGDGISRLELEQTARKRGLTRNVRFLGVREDVPDLLALSDLFVFPSLSEGLPFVLLEAMAAGKPCIGFRIGPMPEVIEDRVTGLLSEPASSAGIAQAVISLLQNPDPGRRMGEQGRERVRRLFHADRSARQLENLYRSVGEQS